MVGRAACLGGLLFAALIGISASMAADRPTRIAFVDTGNTGRSVTAEALAAADIAKGQLDAQVISRAVDLNPYNIHPEANFVTLLEQRGIAIGGHVAAQFGPQDAKFSDLILTMTDAHKSWITDRFPETRAKVFTLGEYATGTQTDVLDAFGKPMAFYRTVLAQLDDLVGAAVMKATTKP
jgi:protein-tyrosine phosphatase